MLNGAPVLPAKMFTLVATPESTVCIVPLLSLKYMIAADPGSRPTGPLAALAHTEPSVASISCASTTNVEAPQ